MVTVPRMRMGKRPEIETLVCEEALLFAQYLRNERKEWIPRINRYLKGTQSYEISKKSIARNLI